MDRFLGSISTTWQIMKDSAGVLRQDKELLFFPVLGVLAGGVLIVSGALILLAILGGTAVFDGGVDISTGSYVGAAVIGITTYMLATFAFIFFNAALVAGALQRVQGTNPTVKSSLSQASSRIWALLGWAIIAGTVSLLLSALRSNAQRNGGGVGGILLAIGLSALIAIWEFITFFTIPVILNEKLGPIGSIKRSFSIVRNTWGKQLAANFGFGLFYFLIALPGVLIGVLVGLVQPIAGGIVGGLLVLAGVGVVNTLASIFKAVLYNYAISHNAPILKKAVTAEGTTDDGKESAVQYKTFSADFLQSAYTKK